ncbi:MAG: hypothetical protein AAGE94_02650 [Acidobacteriota bacterium]
MPTPLVLFGPQRLQPILRPELERLDLDGPVAAITAGWQEREGENDELADHLDREVIDLRLHGRAEEVFAEDPELFRAHRERQDKLQALQAFYRYRLDFALEPARELMRRGSDEPELLDFQRASTIDAIKRLDKEHLDRAAEIHEEYQRRWRPTRRPAVVAHREALEEILGRCALVAIAGGHVAVLLNRLRLFGFGELLRHRPVFAWSAGAMALAERVVLFHDAPPQGAGNPEVLDTGLGLYRGLVPLPHARARLRLSDPVRVALFARRFEPDMCVPLDEGMSVRRSRVVWRAGTSARVLTRDGDVAPMESSS